jgi:hypothetical protein
MKYLFILILFLASCKSTCITEGFKQTPDVLNKKTETLTAKETAVELEQNTSIKTESIKTEAVLVEDTVVVVKKELETMEAEAAVKKTETTVLPKNTIVSLPPDSNLKLLENTKVKLEAETEVILPQGTEIKINKINWYAILFYLLLIFGIAWYYLQGGTEDKNRDGFVDEEKQSKKRK